MNKLEQAARQALEALEQLQGGCTDSNDGTVEAITIWCPDVIATLREALQHAQSVDAQPVDADVQQESPYDRGFRHGYNRRNAEVKGALV